MKKIILLPLFLCLAFSQSEEEVEYVIIQGEHTQKINNSIDIVRAECTEKALNNAISGYIMFSYTPLLILYLLIFVCLYSLWLTLDYVMLYCAMLAPICIYIYIFMVFYFQKKVIIRTVLDY